MIGWRVLWDCPTYRAPRDATMKDVARPKRANSRVINSGNVLAPDANEARARATNGEREPFIMPPFVIASDENHLVFTRPSGKSVICWMFDPLLIIFIRIKLSYLYKGFALAYITISDLNI